jgi:hypothetical protein
VYPYLTLQTCRRTKLGRQEASLLRLGDQCLLLQRSLQLHEQGKLPREKIKTSDKSVLVHRMCFNFLCRHFFGKFLPSTYLLGVTVKNSTETHVEVFMYKCLLVASPLNWDWNGSDLAELRNTKCHDNKFSGSGVLTCGRTHITN